MRYTIEYYNCMFIQGFIRKMLMFVVILSICSCTGGGEAKVLNLEEPIPEAEFVNIKSDSSLYQASVLEWNEAAADLRLANCASLVRSEIDTTEVQTIEEINDLVDELCTCIEEVTYGMPTMNANAALEVADRCLYSMGYR